MFRKLLRNACGGIRGSLLRSADGQTAAQRNSVMEMFEKRMAAENVVGNEFVLSERTLADVSELMSLKVDSAAAAECRKTLLKWPPAWNSSRTTQPPPPACQFLGLDLTGGSHFRTWTTDLRTDRTTGAVTSLVRSKTHALPAPDHQTSGTLLFDHMAGNLASFADEHGVRVRDGPMPVAFTFGFPVRQASPTAARVLHRWTKEFGRAADLVGRDVAAELRGSLERAGLGAGPVTLLNDAAAAMINSAADVPATRASVVVDDGCNCCYVDECAGLVVNTEWGAFGEDDVLRLISTEHDRLVDARSWNPGEQIFEKMTSGMYMGELVREVMLAMTCNGVLFDGNVTQAMQSEYSLNAAHLCRVLSDARGSYEGCREVLDTVLDVVDPTNADCELFRYACECVTKRSAHLVAAGLAGVLHRVSDRGGAIVVAADGTAFEIPKYADTVESVTRQLMVDPCGNSVDLTLRKADRTANGLRLMAGLLGVNSRAVK